jgi:ribosomal protein S18 acetylase RimI-like enzyme
MENKIKFIPFNDELAKHFTALNKAWVEKYFVLEPLDEKMLADPRHYYIDEGGFIYFALYNKEVAGTFALLKVSDTVFELSKMAVDEKFQGKKIGNKILEFCLQEARRLKLDKVILYSNTLLEPAIHLYRKYGFTEVKDFKSEYKRANIKMEIDIT